MPRPKESARGARLRNCSSPTPNHPDNPTNILLDNADSEQNLPGTGVRLVLHGIKAVNSLTQMEELVVISQFFVKNWNFVQGEGKFYAILPFGETLNIQNPDGSVVQTVLGADEGGVDAQGGVSNPVSNFDDHKLYQYKNKYYDPSYGKGSFSDKAAWATESLSGYGTILNYFAPSAARYKIIWLHQKPNATNSNIIKFKQN